MEGKLNGVKMLFLIQSGFSEADHSRYAKPEHLSLVGKLFFMMIAKIINNPLYWNRMMKENGVCNESFARPYKI